MFTPPPSTTSARPALRLQQQSPRGAVTLNRLQQQQGATEFQSGIRKAPPARVPRAPAGPGSTSVGTPGEQPAQPPGSGLRNPREVKSYVEESNLNQDA
ncbi:hypothetical protein [Xylophilus sp. ASV27]|uniref:hypothetical protein n=1 Tax=Xylophilus sp. ASV27 TaxID=2795129 RepID=UPI0018EB76A5|nr:hypothetical protein [Xylophilus sp. ASV27]